MMEEGKCTETMTGGFRSSVVRKPVGIEFHDLCYSVPQGRKGKKSILKNINGQFKAGQLHAIMGPSGAGKSTLLNILAAYKIPGSTGNVLVNGEPRSIRNFRKISRYIMQEDAIQPLLSVQEIMKIAADLKLPVQNNDVDKQIAIDEILELLRLTKAKNTVTNKLSGGERKRLSIALELLNNPPVLFLDEPTTGLDDLCSSQCIKLLKTLAEGGRTVICSIHTPSAKMFSIFDNVYILAEGQCVYQGYGPDVVPYLSNIGLRCPTHFNPADFVIEVSSGDYGNYLEALVAEADKCKSSSYYKRNILESDIKADEADVDAESKDSSYDYVDRSSSFTQFKILLRRMWIQMYRDKMYLFLRFILTLMIGLIIGNLFLNMGQDASKIFFNFGFYYTCIIKFMYIPMMPVLLSFPSEIQLLKREAFNKWYRLTPYFCALTLSTIPVTFILGVMYVLLVYFLTDQPFEVDRILKFYLICMITSMVSESFGLLISSNLNMVNSMFVGPVAAVPLMLLAVYGMGYNGDVPIPLLIRIAMQFSFLRYAFEGLTSSMSANRGNLECPDTEDLCFFRNFDDFNRFLGLHNIHYWVDVAALIGMFVLFRFACFYLLKQRLRPNKTFRSLQYFIRNVKVNFNIGM